MSDQGETMIKVCLGMDTTGLTQEVIEVGLVEIVYAAQQAFGDAHVEITPHPTPALEERLARFRREAT